MATNDQTMDETNVHELDDETVDALIERLDKRAEANDALWHSPGVSRRSVIASLLGVGVGGAAVSGNAAAAGESWSDSSGTVGTDSKPLTEANVQNLDTESVSAAEMSGAIAGGDTISNLAGTNLSIDNNGNLNASGGGGSSSPLVAVAAGTDLQTAVDNAAAGATLVPEDPTNTRTRDARLEITTNDLTLRGFDITLSADVNDTVLWVHACSGVEIEDCDIDGNGDNQSIDRSDGVANLIVVSDASDIYIRGNHLQNASGQGVWVASRPRDTNKATGPVENVWLVENYIHDVQNNSVGFAAGGGHEAKWGWIINNRVDDKDAVDVVSVLDGFQHCVVAQNIINGNNAVVIEQHSGRNILGAVRDVQVVDNIVQGGDAFTFDHPNSGAFRDIKISDNVVKMTNPGGVNTTRALKFSGSGFDINGLTISGNQIRDYDEGLVVPETHSNVSVTDNTLRNISSTPLSVSGSGNSDIVVADNIPSSGGGSSGYTNVASGSITLSSGSATVDTGVSTSTTATFMLALGAETTGADIAGDLRADSGTGSYVVDIEETDTNVGNPSVNYDVLRVR